MMLARYLLLTLFSLGCAGAQTTPRDLTPSQQEGPYYPTEKLADQDSDLTVVGSLGQPARGDLLLLSGKVLGANGKGLLGAIVEIWQTDASGVYMHPNDPETSNRDMNFQFYGESETAEDGSYAFRTVLPGQYEPRPRHIHFKVKLNGAELLTSQLYFVGYEGAGASREPSALTVDLAQAADAAYTTAYRGEEDLIVAAP